MDKNRATTPDASAVANERILADLRKVDRREWWLWSSAMSVTLVLAIGIASFAVPALLSGFDRGYAFFLNDAVRGLFGLVLVFNLYVVYEQVQINRIRRAFADDLYQMAVVDPVTNMFNRRYILHRLEEEIARCGRRGSPLTVIMLDLNCFKAINDDHGHALGDDVLRIFGEQLKRATRGSDVAARYGGDEFLVMLPDCNSAQIKYVLDRLSGLHVKTSQSKIDIRYSAGWAVYIPGESLDHLLKRADDLLYENKRNPEALLVSSVVAE
jgi:diguanylate cyclase (GGDEF)-like protein